MTLQRNPNGSLLMTESGALARECCCDLVVLECGYCAEGRTPQQLIVEFPPFDVINTSCPGVADDYNALITGAAVLDHIGGGIDFQGSYCNYRFEETLGVTTPGLHPSNTQTYSCNAAGCTAAAGEKEFLARRFDATLRVRYEAGQWRIRVTAGVRFQYRYRACQGSGWGNWSAPSWDSNVPYSTVVEMGAVTNAAPPSGLPALLCDEINDNRKPGEPVTNFIFDPYPGVTQFGGYQGTPAASNLLRAGGVYSNTVTVFAFITAI